MQNSPSNDLLSGKLLEESINTGLMSKLISRWPNILNTLVIIICIIISCLIILVDNNIYSIVAHVKQIGENTYYLYRIKSKFIIDCRQLMQIANESQSFSKSYTRFLSNDQNLFTKVFGFCFNIQEIKSRGVCFGVDFQFFRHNSISGKNFNSQIVPQENT